MSHYAGYNWDGSFGARINYTKINCRVLVATETRI